MSITGGGSFGKAMREIGRKYADAPTLRAGFLEGATYPDGTSVAQIAVYNEYGVPIKGQPPRPFFRTTIDAQKDTWIQTMANLLQQGADVNQAMGLTGELMKSDIQQAIRDFKTPELAAVTVARKGFDKPLIDTAHMLNSVDYEMKGGGNEPS